MKQTCAVCKHTPTHTLNIYTQIHTHTHTHAQPYASKNQAEIDLCLKLFFMSDILKIFQIYKMHIIFNDE